MYSCHVPCKIKLITFIIIHMSLWSWQKSFFITKMQILSAQFCTQPKIESKYLLSKLIQHRHICVHIVNIVCVWWIIFIGPFFWCRNITFKYWIFGLWFVVNTVETNNILQKSMEFWMLLWFVSCLK